MSRIERTNEKYSRAGAKHDEQQQEAVKELEPHAYVPSTMHMGDCQVCGHLQGAAIHSPFRRSPQ
jgi:hypothetical protein